MDKSLMFFIAIGMGFLYFVTNFVGDIQAEDDTYQNSEYKKKHAYDKYYTIDSVGQKILDVTAVDAKTQVAIWNHSSLKHEFLKLFPDFSEMKIFINERVIGKVLQEKLLNMTNGVEDKFFSGKMTSEQAKRVFSLLD